MLLYEKFPIHENILKKYDISKNYFPFFIKLQTIKKGDKTFKSREKKYISK